MFITGCDEHGQKIQRTAEAAGLSPQAHCDLISEGYRDLWNRWQISNDRFIRTTDPRHRQLVAQFFARVEANGDVVEGRQQGWYCVACEEFKDDAPGSEDPECPIHRKPLEWRDEVNLFFRLSRYQAQIEALIRQPGFIAPASRQKEVENFVAQGLRDFQSPGSTCHGAFRSPAMKAIPFMCGLTPCSAISRPCSTRRSQLCWSRCWSVAGPPSYM